MTMSYHSKRHSQRGFSYTEILVAAVILGMALVPAIDALRATVVGMAVQSSFVSEQQRLDGRMEEILAQPISALDEAAGAPSTPSSYSDAPGLAGRVLVFLARYDADDSDGDGDPFTGVDEGLIWVKVNIENTPYSLETLTSG